MKQCPLRNQPGSDAATSHNRRSSEIQGTALSKSLRAWTCIYRSMPAGVAQSRHAFVGGTVSTWGRWRIPVNKRQKRHQKCRSNTLCSRGTCRSDSRFPQLSSINYNRSMPEDLKVSQIGSSLLPPPFRGLHSPGVRKHCQIIFTCYFRKSSIEKLQRAFTLAKQLHWTTQ